MKRLFLLTVGLSVNLLLTNVPLSAGGLPKQAQEQIRQRYRKVTLYFNAVSEPGTILVLKHAGIFGEGPSFPEGWAEGAQIDIWPVGTSPQKHTGAVVYVVGTTVVETSPEVGVEKQLFGRSTALDPGTPLYVWDYRFKDDRVELWCMTLDRYPREYSSAFKRETRRVPLFAKVRFFIDRALLEAGDTDSVFETIEEWLQPFENEEEALAFSATLRPAPEIRFEIRLGMTIVEVEKIFGLPERKALLGEKVLYKYKDMTIEFTNGAVSDVKF